MDAAAPEEVKSAIRRFESLTFGPSGVFEQDDGEVWVRMQDNVQGPQVQDMGMALQLGRHDADPSGSGAAGVPGALAPVLSEAATRGWYRQWLNLLEGGAWNANARGFEDSHIGEVTR